MMQKTLTWVFAESPLLCGLFTIVLQYQTILFLTVWHYWRHFELKNGGTISALPLPRHLHVHFLAPFLIFFHKYI